MQFISWMIGPQLIGIIFLISGYMVKRFPPKNINTLYGYRTNRSMQNKQSWDEGNRYSANLMIKIGLILLVIGMAMFIILSADVVALSILPATIITATLVIWLTERHLKKYNSKTP